jgi:hypothetical protein
VLRCYCFKAALLASTRTANPKALNVRVGKKSSSKKKKARKMQRMPDPKIARPAQRTAVLLSKFPAKKLAIYARDLRKMHAQVVTGFNHDPTHFVVPKFTRTM